MKAKLLLMLLCITSLSLVGCNKQIMDFDYKFEKVHIYETNSCYEIKSWKDYEGEQLQLDIKDYGKVLISNLDCFLVKDKCFICDNEKYLRC